MRSKWPWLLGALAFGACGITDPPDWNAEYLFPLNFPAIDLSWVPGGTIPVDSVSYTTDVFPQDSLEFVGRILQSEDLVGLRAEIMLTTNLDVTGRVRLSIATSPANLFSPTQSLTTTIPVGLGAYTSFVPVPLAVFAGAESLYFQSTIVLAGSGGSITVPPDAEIGMGVNFIATVRVSK